jgi:phospholipid/cholesterol/gamma-HCH transport system substrate-binding protein
MLLNDTISGQNLKDIVKNLEATSMEMDSVVSNINTVINDFKSGEGAYNYIVKDTALVNSLESTLKNINEGTDKFNQNMEALKHNFLFRGYFKKLEKKEKKEQNKN